MMLKKIRLAWLVFFLVLVPAAFVVPFLPFMSGLSKLYGAFLFWNAFALVVIAALISITSRWRD